MRIDAIKAGGFGPFAGEMLELAPGMNVIYGPNESGKSSWHAAIYAALCGMRRTRGKPTREDKEFASRHRPWRGTTWGVTAVVSLDDGQTIEIEQGLGSGGRSAAVDRGTKKPLTSDFVREGAVDAATLLGLTRETALATLFVRQADILRVLSDADTLQQYLERAAATSTADATADEALGRIADYKRERVGVLRAGSRGPLATASKQLNDARATLDQAQDRFESYQQSLAAKRTTETELRQAEEQLTQVLDHERERERRERWQEIFAAEHRLRQARSLEHEVAAGPQGDGPGRELLAAVTRALVAYETRPAEPPDLDGPTADDLAQELAKTPEMPSGDQEPAEDVTTRFDAWREGRQRLAMHDENRPSLVAKVDLPAPASELRRLADELEVPIPTIDQSLMQEVERRRSAHAVAARRHVVDSSQLRSPSAFRTSTSRGVFAAAAGLTVLGAALAASGQAVVGAVAMVVGVCIGAIGLVTLTRSRRRESLLAPGSAPPAPPTPDAELTRLEAQLLLHEESGAQVQRRREASLGRLTELGLPAEPRRLRELAADGEAGDAAHTRYAEWAGRTKEIASEVSSAADELQSALVARDIRIGGETHLDAAFGQYLADCRVRAELARRAARRPDLTAQLDSRRAAEAARHQDLAARAEAEKQLLAVAGAAGCSAPTSDELADVLQGWVRLEEEKEDARQKQAQTVARLDQLLEGRTVEELETEIAQLISEAGERPADNAPVPEDRSSELERLESRARDLREKVAGLTGQLEEAGDHLIDVSAAIEAEARVDAQVRELTALAEDLDYAAEILTAAQLKVHADIAPVLNETIAPWIPRITQGRYDDIRVNPATLELEAHEAGGQFRSATVLSHGTTEQLFLLLRLALTKHLATTGESVPLVLDDVTVQSDAQRTMAVLDLLHDLSEERQVVLFSQEDEVLRWAEETLNQHSDQLVRLDVQ